MNKLNNEVDKITQIETDYNRSSGKEVTQNLIDNSEKIESRNIKMKKAVIKGHINYMRIMNFIFMSLFLFGSIICKAGAISVDDNKISFDSSYNTEYTQNNDNNNDDLTEENIKSNNKYKNTSYEGQKYIYDAVEISKRLKYEDYSNNGEKIVFLTFDDGASNTVTPKILKILDDYNVKATFFIMGQTLEDGGENAKKLVKEEYDKGHAIGNHSYCHDYSVLYPGRHLDLEAFKNDYNKNQDELKKILGDNFSTRVIRCPGGYMSWKGMDKLDAYLEENNMASIDWSALSGDAEGKKKDAGQLIKNVVESSKNQEIVVLLMHDTYGKEETVKSLPKIIEYFKGHGYEFRTLG